MRSGDKPSVCVFQFFSALAALVSFRSDAGRIGFADLALSSPIEAGKVPWRDAKTYRVGVCWDGKRFGAVGSIECSSFLPFSKGFSQKYDIKKKKDLTLL